MFYYVFNIFFSHLICIVNKTVFFLSTKNRIKLIIFFFLIFNLFINFLNHFTYLQKDVFEIIKIMEVPKENM